MKIIFTTSFSGSATYGYEYEAEVPEGLIPDTPEFESWVDQELDDLWRDEAEKVGVGYRIPEKPAKPSV